MDVDLLKQKVPLKTVPHLSTIDRMILKEILSSSEKRTSTFLSKKLNVSTATIQRRRKRLEREFLEKEYALCHEKFGWRRVDFFISTISGKTDSVARELLALREVIFVGKSIGAHTIDLRVEAIVKDNSQILELMDRIKAIDGVKQVVWSEIVMGVGNKMSVPSFVIDRI
ncbi:MAG: HTH domain-containing protein [Nitrososphaeraceae archaeon]